MAKGISIFGTLNGTLGETVYYRSGGEQKQRIRNRRPKNPQTNAQIIQRGKFAAAGMFYTHGRQAFFPYAFEDRKPNESNFNAFMRNNVSKAYPVSKDVANAPSYPVFNNWMITKGSLEAFENVDLSTNANNKQTFGMFNIGKDYTLPTTVSQLAKLLIETGAFEDGDIITHLYIISDYKTNEKAIYPDITPNTEYNTRWQISQCNLWVKDNNPLTKYGIEVKKQDNYILISLNSAYTLDNSNHFATAFSLIHSRMTKNGTKVSTQNLYLDTTLDISLATAKYEIENNGDYLQDVIANWKGEVNVHLQANEILQGSNSMNIDFEEVSGE